MAQTVSVKLSRFDSQPWGFRLQGGKDFGQPLAIQKVNGGSLAEKAGLQAGDSVIKINNVDLFNLTHKEAQNALVRAGNSFELTVQRGGLTWKPTVTPIGPTPSIGANQPVTKTSLAYKQPPAPAVGSQHNVSAAPFNGDAARNLTNKVYNSPINIYSEQNIAETLSAQTEVLAGGVLGVNFKKNEKTYNAANSEVLKMVQEIDNEPREPEPAHIPAPVSAPTTPKVSANTVPNPLSGLRHVAAPETKPDAPQDPLKVLPPGQNICADCERLIVGLFVRIKDKNLHVECFKCATCGQSLKNVGYYNINNKLYCDVHAKLVARQNPPAPNLEPITVPPGVKPPSSIIGSALASAPSLPSPGVGPGSPLPGTLGPLPFHAPQGGIRHVNAPRSAPFLSQAPSAAPAAPYAPVAPYASAAPFTPAPSFNPAPASTFQAPKPNLGPAPVPSVPRPLSDATETTGGIHYQSYSTVSQSSYLTESQNASFESSSYSSQSQQQQSSISSAYSNQELSQRSQREVAQSSQKEVIQSTQKEMTQSSQKKMSICSQEVETLHLDTRNMVKQLSEILEGQERCQSPTPGDEIVNRIVESESSKEEELQKIEQNQAWKNYQSSSQLSQQTKETSLAFLRSHSTPVAELEEQYEQQQIEIEEHKELIKKLGVQKRMSVDETKIKEIENQIIASQNQVIEKQEKQKEIEKKKRVRFEEEEQIRRQSLQVQEGELQQLRETVKKQEDEERRKLEEQQRFIEDNRRRQEVDLRISEENRLRAESLRREDEKRAVAEEVRKNEATRRQQSERSQFLSIDGHHERARTPVANLEAYNRHEEMSQKTETIFHTYEHLIQDEEEELQQLQDTPKAPRPVTPARGVSPFPGSIPVAEVNLLLKNIQGIDFEFDLNKATGKPTPKQFKLPDLRNLGNAKPYSPQQPQPSIPHPQQAQPAPAPQPQPSIPPQQASAPQPALIRQQEQNAVTPQAPSEPTSSVSPMPRTIEEPVNVTNVQKQQALLQERQIKEQRKQVHEELFSNERFRKKQERLGAPEPRFERPKTPVAEVEEETRHHVSSERTQHVYDSYDKVIQTSERPRSRIGQAIPENQSISEAEKALFFQNIGGIKYEFENISELTAMKHLPEQDKSLFLRDIEQRTKSPMTVGVNNYGKRPQPSFNTKPVPFQSQFVQALTTIPDPAGKTKQSQEEVLYQQHRADQQTVQSSGLGSNLPKPSPFVQALIIAPDRPYSPLPTLPVAAPVAPVQSAAPAPVRPLVEDSPVAPEPLLTRPLEQPTRESQPEPISETPIYDGSRRRSSGFPGVNVQRTPYQMLRGSQIQSAFQQELKTQETAISQFVVQSETSSTSQRRDTIDAAFNLAPSTPEIAYAAPPPAEKRAELIASQAKFGSAVEIKAEPPKLDPKPSSKPMTMVQALTIAPDRSYSPFVEVPKPQTTLVHGGAAVAFTKPQVPTENTEKAVVPSTFQKIEVKPVYQMKDLQLNKSAVTGAATGFIEDRKSTAEEAGVITGQGVTGSYQCQEEKSSSVIELQKNYSGTAIQEKSVQPSAGFPPVTPQLQAEYSSLKQSESSQKSSSQTQQVQQIGDVTKTTKRSVVEVAESSRKEYTQVRVIGGSGIDPVSGLRRTSNEAVVKSSSASSFQPVASSGLHKPTNIPSYQSFSAGRVSESQVAAATARVEAKDFTPRPRSAIGGKVTKPEPTSAPLAFRSRTPVPIPKIDYPQKAAPIEPHNRNLPTYNQDQIFRSASPRPVPVPKAQFATYGSPQQPKSSLLSSGPTVYRSTSPVPVPHMVKTTEAYQQPMPSWRVQPNKNEKRVSWPPLEESSSQQTQLSAVQSQTSVKSLVSQQEEQAVRNFEEARRTSIPKVSKPEQAAISSFASNSVSSKQQQLIQSSTSSQMTQKSVATVQQAQSVVTNEQQGQKREEERRCSVKAMISAQEEQARKNEQARKQELETRKNSVPAASPATPKTTLAGKNAYPTPKHDPIVAPRPFGTPTPQRKIATPHFQPITPVAITQGSNTLITAPQLTFSTSQASESSLERKTSLTLTSSSASAFKPLDVTPIKPVPCKPGQIPITTTTPSTTTSTSTIPNSYAADKKADAGGPGAGTGKGAVAGATAPRRGRGVLNAPNTLRVPLCAQCNGQIRGPFITALGKIWCPDHFICSTPQCRRPLADIGFVEENNQLYCEFCFEKYIAPNCDKCSSKIKGDCLNAIGKHFHPECFTCAYCGKLFGNSAFFLEDGLPYCENDWNELFTTKCFACGFPIEAGDRWVEALNNNYHSQCFNCTVCKKNLEGQSFFAKGGRPFCKLHAR